MARISSKNAKVIGKPAPWNGEISCDGRQTRPPPPVMRMKKTATAQTMMARVSSQPEISCQAGRAKRKKLSGLPKIGSMTLPMAAGAFQKRASVGHSPIMPAPVTRAMMADPPERPIAALLGQPGVSTDARPKIGVDCWANRADASALEQQRIRRE